MFTLEADSTERQNNLTLKEVAGLILYPSVFKRGFGE